VARTLPFSVSTSTASSTLFAHHDLWDKRTMRAFLLTPREEFVTRANLPVAYEWHHLDIGFGVTITGPHTVGRMTNTIDVQFGEENAPFDKIIVTCGIDHIPPPLLLQLKIGGIIVIPVGPPGAQRVLKIVKEQGADGAVKVVRSDIYGGRVVPFVPFTKLDGDAIKGTHNQQ
jgi:protein-L-isoaspartate O-methyltransferase